jgi:hypothetical protein
VKIIDHAANGAAQKLPLAVAKRVGVEPKGVRVVRRS